MTPRTLLDLGRVSNLPTVWTNVIAGAVLSGGRWDIGIVLLLEVAASFFYVGGMLLNDAFDRDFDARMRPERPIPSGRASARGVLAMGFAFLATGLLLIGLLWPPHPLVPNPGWAPLAAGLVLTSLIVFYDAFHKGNPLSALVMGLCRVTVYVLAAVTIGSLTRDVGGGAAVLLSYVVGLTGVARQETRANVTSLAPIALLAVPFVYAAGRGLASGTSLGDTAGWTAFVLGLGLLAWVLYALSFLHPRRGPRIPRTVAGLIAGISLLDALLIALHGESMLAAGAAFGLPLTLLGQRYVKGT